MDADFSPQCYCASWQYASHFASTVPSSNYSVPSYLTHSSTETYGNAPTPFRPSNSSDQHIAALQEALIPNWTSREFSNFVDACRAIVDELANAETTGSGREQLVRCEGQFQQVIFLWERIWPEVNGLGEEEGLTNPDTRQSEAREEPSHGGNGVTEASSRNGTPAQSKAEPIEIHDEEDAAGRDEDASMENIDSPYGGTGLSVIAAANQDV